MLGAKYLNSSDAAIFAEELLDSCYKVWKNSPTGISPEAWGWFDHPPNKELTQEQLTESQVTVLEKSGFIPIDNRYQLRPGMF